MGGFGSGRYNNGLTVESGLALDINALLRQGIILPGDRVSGTLRWHSDRTGEQRAVIGYEASLLNPKAAWVRLCYWASGRPQEYQVRLTTSPCHYGGYRWWWVCPLSGRQAAKLYFHRALPSLRRGKPTGWATSVSASLHWSDRTRGRAGYTRGSGSNIAYPNKHRRTFAHLIDELHAAKALHREIFEVAASAVLARLAKSDAAGAAVFDVHRTTHSIPGSRPRGARWSG